MSRLQPINTIMKVYEIIQEAPLPPDWDKSTYKSNVSFAQRVRYAVARAQKIGTGSSRIAFEIEYEGRPTVLKIAKNKKGIAQNEYESQMLGDYYLKDMGITIPMIDYDEENEEPTWLHVEKAEKIKPTQFKKFFNGLTPDEVIHLVKYMTGKFGIQIDSETEEKYQQIFEDNEAIDSLVSLVGNYDIQPADFARLANWGIYQNRPVIIDIGASTQVMSQHYS